MKAFYILVEALVLAGCKPAPPTIVHDAATPGSSVKTNWEYRVIDAEPDRNGICLVVSTNQIPEYPMADAKYPDPDPFHDDVLAVESILLDRLGREGWELAAIRQDARQHFIFKRPAQ